MQDVGIGLLDAIIRHNTQEGRLSLLPPYQICEYRINILKLPQMTCASGSQVLDVDLHPTKCDFPTLYCVGAEDVKIGSRSLNMVERHPILRAL